MRTFHSMLSACTEDMYLRVDVKYHSAIKDNEFNLFGTDGNVFLSDILIEDYKLFDYSDGKEHKGIPTGQAYIDEDGDIISWQSVTEDNHPGRLKYLIGSDHILLSSLRLAKSPALNFDFENIDDFVFSNGFYIFKVKCDWHKRFVLFLLRSKKLKQLIDEKIYRGIGISSYKIKDLYKVNIRNLSISEQTAAMELITPIDNKIRALKQAKLSIQGIINTVLKHEIGDIHGSFAKLHKGMSYGTQTAKNTELNRYYSSFLGLSMNNTLRASSRSHNPLFNEFEMSLKNFGVKELREVIIYIDNGVSPEYCVSGDVPVIKTVNITTNGLNLEDIEFVDKMQYIRLPKAQIQCGDILICNIGSGSLGKTTINTLNDKMFAAAETMIVRVDPKKYNSTFLCYFLNSIFGTYQFEREYTGTTNQIHISPQIVERFIVPDISLDEQQRIVDKIQVEIDKQNDINNEIQSLRKQIDKIVEEAISL